MKQLLAEKSLATLNRLGNTPDLNPIENLWEITNGKVADKQPSSAGVLNQVIKEVWVKESSQDLSEKLICCKQQNIQAVIKSKRGRRNY